MKKWRLEFEAMDTDKSGVYPVYVARRRGGRFADVILGLIDLNELKHGLERAEGDTLTHLQIKALFSLVAKVPFLEIEFLEGNCPRLRARHSSDTHAWSRMRHHNKHAAVATADQVRRRP